MLRSTVSDRAHCGEHGAGVRDAVPHGRVPRTVLSSSRCLRTRGCSRATRHRWPWSQSIGSPVPSSGTGASRRRAGPEGARCAPSGYEARLASRVSCRSRRLHVRGHMGKDVLNGPHHVSFCRGLSLTTTEQVVHLSDDLRGICRCSDTQEVVLLESLSRVVAQPLLDLLRKAVQLLVSSDIEAGQYLHQVEDVGDQRGMKARLRLVQAIHHVRDHFSEPLPQIFRATGQGLANACVYLARHPCLLFRRHLNAKVVALRDRQDLELRPELLPQLVDRGIVFLPKEPVQVRTDLLDVLRVDSKKALHSLIEAGLELAHTCHQVEIE